MPHHDISTLTRRVKKWGKFSQETLKWHKNETILYNNKKNPNEVITFAWDSFIFLECLKIHKTAKTSDCSARDALICRPTNDFMLRLDPSISRMSSQLFLGPTAICKVAYEDGNVFLFAFRTLSHFSSLFLCEIYS